MLLYIYIYTYNIVSRICTTVSLQCREHMHTHTQTHMYSYVYIYIYIHIFVPVGLFMLPPLSGSCNSVLRPQSVWGFWSQRWDHHFSCHPPKDREVFQPTRTVTKTFLSWVKTCRCGKHYWAIGYQNLFFSLAAFATAQKSFVTLQWQPKINGSKLLFVTTAWLFKAHGLELPSLPFFVNVFLEAVYVKIHIYIFI